MGKAFVKKAWVTALLGMGWTLPILVFAQAAEPRALTVSEGHVSGNDRSARKAADLFAERIELGRNFKAKRVPACRWYEVPKGYTAESHVHIVDLRFANRLELLAFMFREDGTVSLAARAQALYQERPWFPSTLSPGDFQWPDNAPGDLVARFADAFDRHEEDAGVYHLAVEDWESDPDLLAEDKLPGEGISPNQGAVTRILPLAAAAMVADGFRACLEPRDDAIALSIRMGELDCAIHAVLRRGGEPVREIKRYGIPYEGLYDGLRILFLNLVEWDEAVADWFRPGYGFGPVQVSGADNPDGLLDARKTIIVGMEKDGFAAIDVATGDRLWNVPFEERNGFGASRDGQMFLRWRSRWTRLSSAGERPFRFVTSNSDRMSFLGDLCAAGCDHDLRLLRAGGTLWNKVLPWTILAGPRVIEGGVVVSTLR